MNLFQTVKSNVTAREAAERYGIAVGRNGMACCPFHADKHPSMKLDERFHCFGCGADGDVIDFAARMFNLRPGEAARRLAEDFSIPVPEARAPGESPRAPKPRPAGKAERFEKGVNHMFHVYCEYQRMLYDWSENEMPAEYRDEFHPCFQEALRELERVGIVLDRLILGSEEEKRGIVLEYGKDLPALEARVQAYWAEHGGEPDGAPGESAEAPAQEAREREGA